MVSKLPALSCCHQDYISQRPLLPLGMRLAPPQLSLRCSGQAARYIAMQLARGVMASESLPEGGKVGVLCA